jgi:glutathione peroxidase
MTSPPIYTIPVRTIDGDTITLERFRGRFMLIVNVASRCGFTPQYRSLEALYRRRADDLVVLGFPSNQFGSQEPGTDADIRLFCTQQYEVTFPLFAKIDVNGPDAHPLFTFLREQKRGFLGRDAIAWNFTKFLVSRNGAVLKRYGSRTTPEAIERDLETAGVASTE